MKISAKLTHVESKISDYTDMYSGRNAIVKPSVYIIYFYSPDAKITLEISEQSKLANDLALFRSVNGQDAEFIFDIGGINVDDYFTKELARWKQLNYESDKRFTECMGKLSKCSEISENRLNALLLGQNHVNNVTAELVYIKSKWWYRLFTYFKA